MGFEMASGAKQIKINGIVQGVGYRPFVHNLARRFGLKGYANNTPEGLEIHIEGPVERMEAFSLGVQNEKPDPAEIASIAITDGEVEGCDGFFIRESRIDGPVSTLIPPDLSICDECLKELFTPGDRRYRYPFINCTNCGPRYTIIESMPYDRPRTSMRHFQMCPECLEEYEDPGNRRFHAQPNACPKCGPSVSVFKSRMERLETDDPIRTTTRLLKEGAIIAIKGIGGFHLAADAACHEAVVALRKRKQREAKPFALMAPDMESVQRFAILDGEEKLLMSPRRPIVLLDKKDVNPLSPAVSPHNPCFGVMLPYTPLHYLLLDQGFIALVMTSGNIHDEPMAMDDEEAFERLSGMADYFLTHNRDILQVNDDSVVMAVAGSGRVLRQSRGYAPRSFLFKKELPPVLACGADLKNSICLTRGNRAFVSPHIGDMETVAANLLFRKTIAHMKRIFDIQPEYVAYDPHPDYHSHRFALDQKDLKPIPVQHHHAHIVSCMAEHDILDRSVIGLAFDGTGYGDDGCIWGGEVMLASPSAFRRTAHLAYVPMPGGAAAVREPWRMAVSYLHESFGKEFHDLDLPLFKTMGGKKIRLVQEMISKGIRSPLTSSMGRLFDGIAAIIGLRDTVSYEGQAAMELEAAARDFSRSEKISNAYHYEWSTLERRTISPVPIIKDVVRDLLDGICPARISARFHLTLIDLFSDLCCEVRSECGLNDVVLSGGVFQNRLLLRRMIKRLAERGFVVFSHQNIPMNDGGISLGQAIAASCRVLTR